MTDPSAVERAQQWRRAQPYYASEQFMEDGESWVRADTVEVWLAAYAAAEPQRADQSQAALAESRAREVALKECLQQLVEKLDVTVPHIEDLLGSIRLLSLVRPVRAELKRLRTEYRGSGPSLKERLERARALLQELGTPDQ